MKDTRIWTMDEKEIVQLYKEAGSVAWLQNAIEYLLDWFEVQKGEDDMTKDWYCPHCGTFYDLTKLVDFGAMKECCRYFFGKQAFNLYRHKNSTRA